MALTYGEYLWAGQRSGIWPGHPTPGQVTGSSAPDSEGSWPPTLLWPLMGCRSQWDVGRLGRWQLGQRSCA